jgi:hypothetical protein
MTDRKEACSQDTTYHFYQATFLENQNFKVQHNLLNAKEDNRDVATRDNNLLACLALIILPNSTVFCLKTTPLHQWKDLGLSFKTWSPCCLYLQTGLHQMRNSDIF